jgi:hypothetical protein
MIVRVTGSVAPFGVTSAEWICGDSKFTQVLVRPRATRVMAVSTRQAIVRCRVWRMAGEGFLATTGDRP